MAKFAFIMDPLSTVNPKKDTTYAFMKAAFNLDYGVYFVPVSGLAFRDNGVYFNATSLALPASQAPLFIESDPKWVSSDDFDAVFVRPDPPFDARYLLLTQLLDHVNSPVLNAPSGLRNVGEKLWSLGLAGTPSTVITQDKSLFLDVLRVSEKVVIKPVDGYGGSGVFVLEHGDSNAAVSFEMVSENGTVPVVIQEYLPDSKNGDKRVLTFDGDILGAIRRVHSGSDHRNNLAAGGHAEKATITDSEMAILASILPELQRLGLRFIGFDFIGEKLVEVNVTSPTGLQELMVFESRDFASEIIERLVRK